MVSLVNAFTAPIKQLFEMLSKWPRYRNHGPAIEMWSVVHLPKAFIKSLAPWIFAPSQGSNGLNNCNRCESGFTTTFTPEPSAAGA